MSLKRCPCFKSHWSIWWFNLISRFKSNFQFSRKSLSEVAKSQNMSFMYLRKNNDKTVSVLHTTPVQSLLTALNWVRLVYLRATHSCLWQKGTRQDRSICQSHTKLINSDKSRADQPSWPQTGQRLGNMAKKIKPWVFQAWGWLTIFLSCEIQET